MANHKRKKRKLYLFVSCCRDEAIRMAGNSRFRYKRKDFKQPQMYIYHDRDPERYKGKRIDY